MRHIIFGGDGFVGRHLAPKLVADGEDVVVADIVKSDLPHYRSVRFVTCDVTDPASVEALAGQIDNGSLDVVLVNAGIIGGERQSVADASTEDVTEVMMTNAVGPARAAKQLLPLLRDGGTLAFMTSRMGSIAESSGGFDLYRMSKAAQNILAKGIFEQDAKARDIAMLSLHPGWVQTDMGGPGATLTVAESVQGLADVLEAEHSPTHRFLAYDGSEIPW